jgi:hypothetical protein
VSLAADDEAGWVSAKAAVGMKAAKATVVSRLMRIQFPPRWFAPLIAHAEALFCRERPDRLGRRPGMSSSSMLLRRARRLRDDGDFGVAMLRRHHFDSAAERSGVHRIRGPNESSARDAGVASKRWICHLVAPVHGD